jgi:uncharacterized protein YlxP (DUF503 family)
MFVGVCRLTLMCPDSGSLKDKRMVLRRIKDRVQLKFNVAIAEVGDQEAWQAAQLGFCVVSNERTFTETMVDKIVAFIDDLGMAKLMDDEKDIIAYGDGELETGQAHWEPEEPSPMGAGRAPVFGRARPKLKLPVRGARRGSP